MVGPFNKQAVSSFTGNATRMIEAEDRKLVAAIDVYASDFGEMKIVPNRFQRERDCHVLQTDMWSISYLRPMFVSDIAKHRRRHQEAAPRRVWTPVQQRGGFGGVYDLTSSNCSLP
jgi:hypothetical protein